MTRYQIAINQNAPSPCAYRFKPSRSMTRVLAYMKRCIDDGVMFDATGIKETTLDSAVIALSKELKIPIITGSGRAAKLLSIIYGHNEVFPIESIPKKYKQFLGIYFNTGQCEDGPCSFLTICGKPDSGRTTI